MTVGRRHLAAPLVFTVLAVAVAVPRAARADAGAGAISGQVTTTAAAACVLVLDPTGQAIAATATDGGGRYVLDAVPTGRWIVEFVPDDGCLGADTADGFQYYAGAATAATATLVTISAGQTTGGVDAALAAGALVTGIVTDPSGNGLPGVCVLLEDTAGNPVVREPTDSGGIYKIDQLPAGHFILQFVDDACVGRAPEFAATFLGGPAPATATVLDLHAGQIDGHLDEMLNPLASGGTAGPVSGGGTAGQAPPPGPAPIKPAVRPNPPVSRTSAPRAIVSLLGAVGGRFTVDTHHRLHLRLRCAAGGLTCRMTVTVNRVRRRGKRLVAGARAGSHSATIRPGRTLALRVPLRGGRSNKLWIVVRGRDRRILVQTVIPVRWPRSRGRR